MKVGFVNTFIDIAILQFAINTWGYAYFNLGEFPDWANRTVASADVLTTVAP